MNIEQEIKLRAQLAELHKFPDVYLFKFIVPNEPGKKEEVLEFFSEKADVSTKKSRNGKYMAISIKEVMISVDAVMQRYHDLKSVKGLMSL